jgi:hypothetical protein
VVLGLLVPIVGLGWATSGVATAAEPVPAITVAPSSDLVDRQTVTVTGTGFSPNTFFGAAQCDAAAAPEIGIDACDLSTSRTSSTDADGNVQIEMPVRRIITVQGNEIDCALSACIIGAATLDGTTPIESTGVPIAFDPSVPPVPPLEISITVDKVTLASVTGTVTCNRAAQTFADVQIQQQKGTAQAFAYGYTDEPITCGPAPVGWTAPVVDTFGVFTGGPATYQAFASAYDGFEDAFTEASGAIRLSRLGHRGIVPANHPGVTVSVDVIGTTRTAGRLAVDLLVTCDRAVPYGFAYVSVTQRAGLREVNGYGQVEIGACDGATVVSVPVEAYNGMLVGGPAEVRADVEVIDFEPPGEEFFDYASTIAAVRLKGTVRPAVVVQPNPTSRITINGATSSTLAVTISCAEAAQVEVYAQVVQTRGRTINDAFAYQLLDCDGRTSITIPLEGRLAGGPAAAFVYATAYRIVGEDYEFLWDDQQAAELRIRG